MRGVEVNSSSDRVDRLSPAVRRVLDEFRRRVIAAFGDRVIAMRLFGSQARGEASEDSDIDVLVVLEAAQWSERRAVLDMAGDLFNDYGQWLSPTVFDRETFEKHRRQERPLVMQIEQEGLPL